MKNQIRLVPPTLGELAIPVLQKIRQTMTERQRRRYDRSPEQIAQANALAKRINGEKDD